MKEWSLKANVKSAETIIKVQFSFHKSKPMSAQKYYPICWNNLSSIHKKVLKSN
jgi:hypothetical protein